MIKVLLDIGIEKHKPIIHEFSSRVDKQWQLEKKLNEMIDQLRLINIVTAKYKNTYVIERVDDVVTQLDEVFNILIIMKSSPYIKPILKRAHDLELKLLLV